MARVRHSRHSWLFALMVLALAVRMVIPSGWMPSFADGRATITLCTSAGMVEAWLDDQGKIHKDNPAKKSAADQPCAFAGLSAPADSHELDSVSSAMPFVPQRLHTHKPVVVAIGHGLAAPPPPATAPPALI